MADCLIVNETEASFYAGVEVTDGDMVRAHADKLRRLTEGTAVSYTHLDVYKRQPYEERVHAFIDSFGTAVSILHDVDRENLGVTLDFCHTVSYTHLMCGYCVLALQPSASG